MASSIRTLSQLPEISANSLLDNAYFETSIPIAVSVDLSGNTLGDIYYKYASRKIQNKEVRTNINNYVRSKLKSQTGIDSQDFGQMYRDYSDLISGDFTLDGTKTFVENPIILKDAISDFNDCPANYSVSLSALKRYTNINASPAIGPSFGFVTTLSSDSGLPRNETLYNIDTQNRIVYSSPRYVFSPESAKIISENEYIFKIKQGERFSDVWTAPATGIFTCYGWLDEINNDSVSNEKRWVALLGFQKNLGVWTTLQVQPFIKNNSLSYVGFTFPVHKGLQLKIQTGFAVGNNSDKYFRSGASLANHQANAFLGGVYTGLSVDFDNLPGGNYSVCADPNLMELSARLEDLISHENSCDISINNKIDELSGRLATGEVVDNLSSEIDKRVKYIDTYSYTSNPIHASVRIYNRMFDTNAANGDPNYQQICLDSNGRQASNVPLLYCDLTSFSSRSFKDYYAPPEFSETLESGETGWIERAYIRSSDSPYGRVLSDGKYMFYCVSQDCTAVIRLHGDFTGRGSSGVAAYMLCPKANPSNMTVITIGKNIEWMGNITDPQGIISLPVKKGTIFMFCPWHTERREDGNGSLQKAMAGCDTLAKTAFLATSAPCIVPNSDGCMTNINSIYDRDTYTSKLKVNGKDAEYKSYAVWTSNSDQRANLVGSGVGQFDYLFGNADSHGDNSYGSIATIVELP